MPKLALFQKLPTIWLFKRAVNHNYKQEIKYQHFVSLHAVFVHLIS